MENPKTCKHNSVKFVITYKYGSACSAMRSTCFLHLNTAYELKKEDKFYVCYKDSAIPFTIRDEYDS